MDKCNTCLLKNLHCGECDGCYDGHSYIKDPRLENQELQAENKRLKKENRILKKDIMQKLKEHDTTIATIEQALKDNG